MSSLRVFISSTMKDLANERDAIVRRIKELYYEPVNAESWLPDGTRSWERIEQELDSCHLFLLLSGERYGWIPDSGPGAEKGLSVTHLEVTNARRMELPILAFLKRLGYDSPRDTDDARRRDAFRQELKDWTEGYFVAEFDLASDLTEKVGQALQNVLTKSFLNDQVKERAGRANPVPTQATEARREVVKAVQEFKRVRGELPFGPERTLRMNAIAPWISKLASQANYTPAEIDELLEWDREGAVLVVLGILQTRADPRYFDLTLHQIDEPAGPYQQWLALLAMENLLPLLSADQRSRVADVLVSQEYIRPENEGRWAVSRRILSEIGQTIRS